MLKWLRGFLAGLLALTMLLAIAVGAWVYSMAHTPTQNTKTLILEIEQGASFRSVVRQLADLDIYPHTDFLWYWARLRDQTAVRAGEYAIAPNLSVADLLALLNSDQVVQHRITFIEGWTLRQWRDHLAQDDRLVQQLPELDDAAVAQVLAMPTESPEGWLYPETYAFVRGSSDLDLLRRAHRRMMTILDAEWSLRSEAAVVSTPYEALILASIIEAETGADWERGEISGVFSRRLQLGMRLQADPTVIYGMGDAFTGRLLRSHLQAPTPWNTYTQFGLPLTPIAMPGRASIHAALNPEPGDTLYFVARGDGTHHFSSTLAEHNAAVTRYQRQRREDYRSSPPPLPPEVTP